VTAYLGGFHGDLNETFTVGAVDEAGRTLVRAAHDALAAAIEAVRPGVRFRDIGDIISKHVHQLGLSVVKTYCGHGIGDLFHCAPSIPHYTHNKAVGVMKEGQVSRRAVLWWALRDDMGRPIERSIDRSTDRSTYRSTDRSVDRSVGPIFGRSRPPRPTTRPASRPASPFDATVPQPPQQPTRRPTGFHD
jgi:hypothetical protein